jgi:hypothetical protein
MVRRFAYEKSHIPRVIAGKWPERIDDAGIVSRREKAWGERVKVGQWVAPEGGRCGDRPSTNECASWLRLFSGRLRGPGVEFVVGEKLQAVHGEAEVGEGSERGGVGGLLLHAALHAEETLAEGALFVGVAELAQERPHLVGETPGFFDLTQRGGEVGAAGLHFLEDAALEDAALVRPVGVEPAGAVGAQGVARLGKARDRFPAARKGHGQAQ